LTESFLETLLRKALEEPYKPKYVKYVYHGTRCPTEVILTKGLAFDNEALIKITRELAQKIGIDFHTWSKSRRNGVLCGKYLMDKLEGNERGRWRARIWVTASFSNAKSYAYGNPEIICTVIESMMLFKYPHRSSRKFMEEIRRFTRRVLAGIGSPKVVVIKAFHPMVNLRVTKDHFNIPLKTKVVPPDAIERIIAV